MNLFDIHWHIHSSIKIQTFKKQSHNLCGYPVLKTPQERGNAEDETENTR